MGIDLTEGEVQQIVNALHHKSKGDESIATRPDLTERLAEQFQRQAQEDRKLAEALERGDTAIPECDECGAIIPHPLPYVGDREKGLPNRHHRRSCSLFDSKG